MADVEKVYKQEVIMNFASGIVGATIKFSWILVRNFTIIIVFGSFAWFLWIAWTDWSTLRLAFASATQTEIQLLITDVLSIAIGVSLLITGIEWIFLQSRQHGRSIVTKYEGKGIADLLE